MKLSKANQAIIVGVAMVMAASTAVAQDATTTEAAPAESASSSAAPAEPAPAVPVAEPAPASQAAPSAPAAPVVAKLNAVDAAPEDKAQIVFFRPSRFVGMAVSFSVREGDKGIGKLTNGSYFVHLTEPGIKEYNISFEARDTLKMEVEAGETYYVTQGIAMGVVAARPNITPSTESAFQEKALKVTKAKATDRK
jgi:hypothetical protein